VVVMPSGHMPFDNRSEESISEAVLAYRAKSLYPNDSELSSQRCGVDYATHVRWCSGIGQSAAIRDHVVRRRRDPGQAWADDDR
jgi:hypothetical protein